VRLNRTSKIVLFVAAGVAVLVGVAAVLDVRVRIDFPPGERTQ